MMKEKMTWKMGTAELVGGGLDGLMILGALERIEKKLDAIYLRIQSKKRRGHGSSGPCGPTTGGI